MNENAGPGIRLLPEMLGGGLATAWHWWCTELAQLIPQRWRQRLHGRERILTYADEAFEYTEGGRSVSIPLSQAAQHPVLTTWRTLSSKASLLVVLPTKELLHKVVSLPAVTEARLSSVLGYELDRHTPFSTDSATFGFRVVRHDRTAQRIDVELFVLPDVKRRRILDALSGAGLTPDGILPAELADDHLLRRTLNLLPAAASTARGGVIGVRRPALVLLAVVALIGFLFYQRSEHLKALQADVAARASVAQQAQKVRTEIDTLNAGGTYIRNLKQARPAMLVLMEELTRLLPDNTWLNRLELQQNEMRLQGESGSASALIGVLEKSPLFQSAEFSSPVTINPRTNKERFSLTLKISQEKSP